MVQFDQPAAAQISSIQRPFDLALDVADDLVEWEVNVFVSIPASFKVSLTHLDTVDVVTPLCGGIVQFSHTTPQTLSSFQICLYVFNNTQRLLWIAMQCQGF